MSGLEQRTRAIERAADLYAQAVLDLATQSPAEAAAAAYTPGGPSVAELTDRIKERNSR